MWSNRKSYFYWWEHKIVQPLEKMSGFFDVVVFAVDLRGSSSDVISYCLFLPSMGFSRQEYWSGLPFPSSEDHVLSEFFTMTHLSWEALPVRALSFTELHKPCHDKTVIHEGEGPVILSRGSLWRSLQRTER